MSDLDLSIGLPVCDAAGKIIAYAKPEPGFSYEPVTINGRITYIGVRYVLLDRTPPSVFSLAREVFHYLHAQFAKLFLTAK